MSATAIRASLKSAPSKDSALIYEQQANLFEEELLGISRIPQEYLQLLLDVISDASFASQPGAWNFVVRMYTDREKLSSSQVERILDGFIVGYQHYADEEMRLVACDFVARVPQSRIAIDSLAKMAATVKSKERKGPLRVGAEIVSNRVTPGSPESLQLQDLMERLRT